MIVETYCGNTVRTPKLRIVSTRIEMPVRKKKPKPFGSGFSVGWFARMKVDFVGRTFLSGAFTSCRTRMSDPHKPLRASAWP